MVLHGTLYMNNVLFLRAPWFCTFYWLHFRHCEIQGVATFCVNTDAETTLNLTRKKFIMEHGKSWLFIKKLKYKWIKYNLSISLSFSFLTNWFIIKLLSVKLLTTSTYVSNELIKFLNPSLWVFTWLFWCCVVETGQRISDTVRVNVYCLQI